MLLTIGDLPSGGRYGIANPVTLRPLNFMQVLDYNNIVAGNPLKQYLKDLNILLKMDPSVINHSLYDLDYLIFMMKVHTISDNVDFSTSIQCKHCQSDFHTKFTLGDFKFKDQDPEEKLIQAVVLGGYKYKVKIPTVGEFLYVMDKYNLYNKVGEADVVKLISLFPEFQSMPNDVENAVLNAELEDISVLYFLEQKFLTSVEPVTKYCNKCNDKRGTAVRIDSLIANMFRDVLLNNQALELKILFE